MASDRGDYRPIARVLVNGPDFQALSERARTIFLYLKINFGPSGLEVHYRTALAHQLAEQSGVPAEAAAAAMDELEAADWIRREGNVVWIVGQLEFDPHMSATLETHRKSIQRHVAGLPRLGIVRDFIELYAPYFTGIDNPTRGYPAKSLSLVPSLTDSLAHHRIPNTEDSNLKERDDKSSRETEFSTIPPKSKTAVDGPSDGDLMALIRKRFYAPDGKPPTGYQEGREFSCFKMLRKMGYSGQTIADRIEGAALIRDAAGHVNGDTRVSWLEPPPNGEPVKMTMRALIHAKSGVCELWQLAEMKLAETSKSLEPKKRLFEQGGFNIQIGRKAVNE